MAKPGTRKIGFSIDRGGTFTDVVVIHSDDSIETFKLLSEDRHYADAPTEAIRRVLSKIEGRDIPRGEKLPTGNISFIRMATTVATNALITRKGTPTALFITEGFRDVLQIGNQSRKDIFKLNIETPEMLYQRIFEVKERVVLVDPTCQMDIKGRREVGRNGQEVIVEQPLDVEALREALETAVNEGIQSIAVVLMHSYIFPNHEEIIRREALAFGFRHISLSSSVAPMIKIVPRGFTSTADAYLTPIIQDYINRFKSGFANDLVGVTVEFMQSDGGLCSIEDFIGSKAILSGPAGGIVGIANTAYDKTRAKPVISFDMGGTSTDVSRYAGHLDQVLESETDGIIIQSPQLEIHTVAAGGGSMLAFRNGLFYVGPESSGSNPGPLCYRKNGSLSVTDANLVLGRLIPSLFPKIFGPSENEELDLQAATAGFQAEEGAIDEHLTASGGRAIDLPEIALGYVKVANEAMCRPIRRITEARGYNTAEHVLACFGGAGGQHACAIADILGITEITIPRHAGVLSAYGLLLADVVAERQEPLLKPIQGNFEAIKSIIQKLKQETHAHISEQGISDDSIRYEVLLHMRYDRTNTVIICSDQFGKVVSQEAFVEDFEQNHKREFGFLCAGRPIIVDDVRVRSLGQRCFHPTAVDHGNGKTGGHEPKEIAVHDIFFENGYQKSKVYLSKNLEQGHVIPGPALVIDDNCTILIEPAWTGHISANGDVNMRRVRGAADASADSVDDTNAEDLTPINPIDLAIFGHRFMSIAEQMGSVLKRSAISTNIKERLDFSCALFGPDGGLVANAPHIPVHLGGMQSAVKFQIEYFENKGGIREGDVILSNHPVAGGSHLPDFTVITPVYISEGSDVPDFFVANRGHHADIGGIVPGSVPPDSTSLSQEGAIFKAFKVVETGVFQETSLIDHLRAPEKIPGSSGARNISDNIADLHAQIAANQKGISLLRELVASYGIKTVKRYMARIQRAAADAVQNMLEAYLEPGNGGRLALGFTDYMDDGSTIVLNVTIDKNDGKTTFDFTGTTPQVYSSSNAPRAVTMAAVIYALRCLVNDDIPLNQGCLESIEVIIPPGSLLDPDPDAAVVGGNVVTSQRVCDVIFGAFRAVAASQGCMNNVTFGDDTLGYYETVGGGAGAGRDFHGRHGVHTHMTNTRITDPEILESRYPVILRCFGFRENSGGRGLFNGGNGLYREIQFRRPMILSVLTERRANAPYGIDGGEPGERGLNLLYKAKKDMIVNIGPRKTLNVEPGDKFLLSTPGGGGWGQASA